MYSYPITPEQLKVMWHALCLVYDTVDLPMGSRTEQTYRDLKEYFEEED